VVNKPYKDKDWLYHQYWELGKSTRQIAKELKVDPATIRNWLIRFDIPRREPNVKKNLNKKEYYKDKDWLYYQYYVLKKSKSQIARECGIIPPSLDFYFKKFGFKTREEFKPYMDKDRLYQEYVVNRKSSCQIAKELGVDDETIRIWLIRHNIERREKKEACSTVKNYNLTLSEEFKQMLDGLLLGDGCLTKDKRVKGNAYYQHGDKHKNYIEWLRQQFIDEGLECSRIYRKEHKRFNSVTYHFITKPYPCLTEQYLRWYPEGKKIVPKDLELTPIVCLHWYIGDGSLIKRYNKKRRPYIHLYTNSFFT